MTDEEIIEYLQDYAGAPSQAGLIASVALKFINRQKEEIERLKRSLDNMTDALIRTDDYCRDLECKGGKDDG